jgi:hypothetical protein
MRAMPSVVVLSEVMASSKRFVAKPQILQSAVKVRGSFMQSAFSQLMHVGDARSL